MNATTERYSGIKMGRLLRSRGIRFDWFAQQMSVSGASITRWTKGDRTMDRAAAERAAQVLGVPFDLLFDSPIGNEVTPSGTNKETAAA